MYGALYTSAVMLAGAGWLLLLAAPHTFGWPHRIAAKIIPLILCGAYVVLMAPHAAFAVKHYGSLDALRTLMTLDVLLLAGWIHYLAFDLFIGGWMARQAHREDFSRLLLALCLVLTFLFGPAGLGLFCLLRLAHRRWRGEG